MYEIQDEDLGTQALKVAEIKANQQNQSTIHRNTKISTGEVT